MRTVASSDTNGNMQVAQRSAMNISLNCIKACVKFAAMRPRSHYF